MCLLLSYGVTRRSRAGGNPVHLSKMNLILSCYAGFYNYWIPAFAGTTELGVTGLRVTGLEMTGLKMTGLKMRGLGMTMPKMKKL